MKKTFIGVIVLSSLSHFAAAESYTEKFYRKLTTAELSWAQKQEALKEVNCSEYLIKKQLPPLMDLPFCRRICYSPKAPYSLKER